MGLQFCADWLIRTRRRQLARSWRRDLTRPLDVEMVAVLALLAEAVIWQLPGTVPHYSGT